MPERSKKLEILSGWKDIANYLGKGVRTVQRYERELGLPIRRPAGRPAGSVVATKPELDAWIAASPLREQFRLPQTAFDNAGVLAEFKRHMAELQRLRHETTKMREAMTESLELLRTNLQSAMVDSNHEPSSSPARGSPADVLRFDPKKKAT